MIDSFAKYTTKMNNDLTILIPTKDRKLHVNRWLSYANDINFPYKLFIADGAKDNTMFDFFSKTECFPNVNYEYVKFPFDKSHNEVWLKLYESLKQIKTKYVAIGNDDDLFCTSGLTKCLDFMKNNTDFSSCGGRIGTFSSKYFTPSNLYISSSINALPESVTDESSLNRIKQHFKNYALSFYDVTPTELALKAYKHVVESRIKNVLLIELVTSFITVASGKRCSLDEFYLFREETSHDSWSEGFKSNRDGDQHKVVRTIFDQMSAESWSDDVNKFFKIVAKIVSDKDEINFDTSIIEMKNGYSNYCTHYLIKDVTTNFKKNVNKKRLHRKIFEFVIKIIKNFDKNYTIRNFINKNKVRGYPMSGSDKYEMNIILDILKKLLLKNTNMVSIFLTLRIITDIILFEQSKTL